MTFLAPVQLATSPKSNQVIWLVKDLASISVVKPGFSTFGVEVASSTSSAIKFGSLGSPTARRGRRLPEVSAVTAGVSVASASTPAATSSFLSVAVASVALLLGFVEPSATAGVATAGFSSVVAAVVGSVVVVGVAVTGASAL
ncbi:hypothetical protein D8785_09005 [Streptococcus australis]|nr:hypothetical protein D8785_09005 [Streptococcus australis]